MLNALKEAFRPEFLNRVDEVIVFHGLGQVGVETIARGLLEEIIGRVKASGIRLSFEEQVAGILASEGFDPQYGARPLRRAAIKLIEEPLTDAILSGGLAAGDHVMGCAEDGKIYFRKLSPEEDS
jgi:ATP-dependent Clp protease ATP-binding subunit ClpA